MNLYLLWFIYRKLKAIQAFHILVGNLASACAIMSFTCGVECLLGFIDGNFYGGDAACAAEAYFHISSILAQFFSTSAIAGCHYLIGTWQFRVRNRAAYAISTIIWVVCITVTLALSVISPPYLMSNGIYCFFDFNSPAIAYWLVPGLGLCLLSTSFFYIRIFTESWRLSKVTASSAQSFDKSKQLAVKLAVSSFSLVFITFVGWSPAAVTTGYEWAVGRATQVLVTAVGIFGTLHSVMIPLAYGYFIHRAHTRSNEITRVFSRNSPPVATPRGSRQQQQKRLAYAAQQMIVPESPDTITSPSTHNWSLHVPPVRDNIRVTV